MTTNFTSAEQQALKICQDDGVCLSPSVMLNSLELLGFKPESATVAQLGAGARALRKLQRMSHGAIAALCQPTPGGFDVVTTSRKDFDNLQSIKKAIK